MMISEEQAALAASRLRTGARCAPVNRHPEISEEILSAAVRIAVSTPDSRPERVALARKHLVHEPPDAHDIADKVIARILGDSVC